MPLRTSCARSRFLLLAPPDAALKLFGGKIIASQYLHAELLSDAQRLRGRVYLDDGAIEENKTNFSNPRHRELSIRVLYK